MLPPVVRTVLSWASIGVAVGVVAAIATTIVLRAEPDLVRVPDVLIIVPIPLGLAAGMAAGSAVAAGRGGSLLLVVALCAAVVAGPFAPLAPVPLVLALAGVRVDPRGWRRIAAGGAIVLAAGIGLVGVPAELAAAGAMPRGLGLAVGAAAGVVVAWMTLTGSVRAR